MHHFFDSFIVKPSTLSPNMFDVGLKSHSMQITRAAYVENKGLLKVGSYYTVKI